MEPHLHELRQHHVREKRQGQQRPIERREVDEAQRGRQLKGIKMLSGFSWDGSAWSGGKVYNPSDGGTYSGKITPVDANSLKLRGCIIWPACKTDTWTRVR